MPKQSKILLYLTAFAVLVSSGCGKKSEEPVPAADVSSPAPAAARTVDAASAGTVKGRVLFSGEAPERGMTSVQGNPECAAFHKDGVPSEDLIVNSGGLQNVFVYVKEGLEGYRFETPVQPALMSNRGCVYVPHVLGVQVDQPVTLVNEDPTLHNIHSYAKNSKGFNLGLPIQGMKQVRKFTAPEVMVQMKCDVHPWMTGWIGVLPHPCFGVSGADGSFEIAGLPPGTYVLEAWHEKLGTRSQTIEIGPRETKQADFTFGPQP